MKKIILLIIIFFSCFVCGKTAFASEEDTNYWTRTHESNIELISNDNFHTLNISNMIKDYYYIFYIKDLSGNDIDYTIINATVDSPYSFSFRRFAANLTTNLDLDTVSVFKASESVVSISFTYSLDFKYAILEENYNELDLTLNDTTSISNDLLVLNAHVSGYNSDDSRLITAGVGLNNEQVSKYFYFYIPYHVNTNKSVFTFILESEDGNESIDFNLCSYENNIYKFRVRDISTDFFDRYSEFKIAQINTSDTSISRMNSIETVAEQNVVLDIQQDEVNFTTVDHVSNIVDAQYNYYTVYEPSYFWGNCIKTYYRFHYVLFDVYIDNKKLDNKTTLERIELNYDMSYKQANSANGSYYSTSAIAGDEKLLKGQEMCDDMFGSYTEMITSSYQTYPFNSQIDTFGEWFCNLFYPKETVYPFDTLTTNSDEKLDELKDLDYKEYVFCLFMGSEANNGSYAFEAISLSYDGWLGIDMHISHALSEVTYIEFVEVEYLHAGQKYTAKIDQTNVAYEGASDFWPGDEPYDQYKECPLCSFFGWSSCILCWLATAWFWFKWVLILSGILIVVFIISKFFTFRRNRRLDKMLTEQEKARKKATKEKKATNTPKKAKKPSKAKK